MEVEEGKVRVKGKGKVKVDVSGRMDSKGRRTSTKYSAKRKNDQKS